MKKPKVHIAGTQRESAKLKRGLRVTDGMVAMKREAQVKKIKKKLLLAWMAAKTDEDRYPLANGRKSKQNQLTVLQATAEHLAGESQDFVERKYKLSNRSVQTALKFLFPSQEQREVALENLLLDNAIESSMVFKEKAHTMSPRDAAVTAGIFTERYSGLKKARSNNHAPDMPIAQILVLQQTLDRAKEVHGKILDID